MVVEAGASEQGLFLIKQHTSTVRVLGEERTRKARLKICTHLILKPLLRCWLFKGSRLSIEHLFVRAKSTGEGLRMHLRGEIENDLLQEVPVHPSTWSHRWGPLLVTEPSMHTGMYNFC